MELNQVYQAILENMNEQVYVRNLYKDILYINPASEKLTGWSFKEAQGKKCYEIFGNSSQSCRDICPVEKAISLQEPVLYQKGEIETRSGKLLNVQVSVSPLYKDETVAGAVVVMEDISHFKEIEQTNVKDLIALENENKIRILAEERLSKINDCFLNFVPDPIENINCLTALCGELLHGTCALYNRIYEGLLYSWGQWKTPSDYNPVDKPDGHICYDVIKNGAGEVFVVSNLQNTNYAQTDPNVISYKLQTYVGKAVKFSDSYVGSLCVVFQDEYVPSDSEKEIIGIIASAIGVEEERRQAEEALRDSEARLEALSDASFEAIFLSDKGVCLDQNKTAERMFGYIRSEAIGRHGSEWIVPKDRELVKNNMLSGREKPYEVTALRKDGTTFPCEIQGRMIEYQGRTIRITALRNITERKRVEKELRKAHDELEIKVNIRTAELAKANELLRNEIKERERTELSLIERGKELENKTHDLEEVNAALNVLLKRREQDKKDLEEKVLANVKEFVFPYVEKLNNCLLSDRQKVYLNIIKSNLEEIIAPFLHQLSSKYSDLTPMEIQVAGFVKDGKTTKEIAELLSCSKGTIDFHRNNIRKKLGLRNTKKNLRSFLLLLT